jgi:hypothetical protein
MSKPLCKVEQHGEAWACGCCGFTNERTFVRVCKQPCLRGLGDAVERVLIRFGIRKRKGCGCNKRQSWLNQKVPFARNSNDQR